MDRILKRFEKSYSVHLALDFFGKWMTKADSKPAGTLHSLRDQLKLSVERQAQYLKVNVDTWSGPVATKGGF